MPSKPVLSESDKGKLRQKLLALCEELWGEQGYKKTSIKELCGRAEIAIGTFYSLFPTKEDLFFETAKTVQTRLTQQFLQTVLQEADKAGLAKAMKELYREYDSKPFMYNVNTPDFRAFVAKLSGEAMEDLRFESISFFREVCQAAGLESKIDETKACGILSALLSTIAARQTLSEMCDYFDIFDFMVDNLVTEIFV